MVRKKLALAILALSALQADLASALGLGSLSVKSSLNQPLNAEIRLLDTGDLDPSQIKIRLAEPEDFERAGVDRNFFLTNLKFTVDMDGRGSGTVRITTFDPVVEPYLNFVVEARWPSGRLLREFAVLLDPPTFSGGAAQPAPRMAPAPASAAQPVRELEPPRVTTEGSSTTADRIESNTLPEAANPGEHRVQVGETLSQIAGRFRPAEDVTTQQTMLAIQRANPDAFIQNNVNLIRSGAILRLPGADEARAVSAADAGQQVAEQSHAWRSGAGSGGEVTGPQLDASQSAASAEGGPQEGERLTIATPGNSDKATAGEGAGGSQKGLQALRNQLTASQESLDSAKRENDELQSRLDSMEQQVATLQRLIAIKDDQLAALQDKGTAAAAPSATAPAATPADTSEPAVAQAPAAAAPAPVAEAPTPAPAPVAAKPKPAAKPAPQPAPRPGLIEQITSNPLYLSGGVAALLLAIGGAVFAKKRRERMEEEAAEEFDLRDYSRDDRSRDDSEIEAPLDFDADRIGDEPAATAQSFATEPETKTAVRPETGDAIAEADIYIAYGRYQQAVDLLTGAIDAEPTRSDLRIKLLEVLLEMRDRDAFRQQFMALQSLGDADAVAQIKEMLSSVEGVSDWLDDLPTGSSSMAPAFVTAGAATAGVAAASLAAADDDLGDELIQDDPSEAVSESDLELDLDLDDSILDAPLQTSSFEGDAGVQAQVETGVDTGFDLDLDLDDTTGEFGAAPESDAGVPDFGSVTADIATDVPASGDSYLDNAAAADELELDLDDSELELDLNEEDLDFALRAMGEAEANPVAAPVQVADNLADFDLSLDEVVPAAASAASISEEERRALEADLGDLGDLEGLDDLGFDEPALAGDSMTAPVEAEPAFAELAPEPAPAPVETPVSAGGDDFDFLADTDEVATKLDLARAYIDMGDTDGAKDILDEVLQEGSDVQKQEASELLDRIV